VTNSPIRAGLLILSLAMLGCSPSEDSQQRSIPEVRTTFYPTTYFTQRIAGELVKVVCPLPPGEDPITWMPNADTIAAYQQADLIVINGASFEKWTAKVSLPTSKLIDTAAPLADEFVKFANSITHSHGSGGQHDHIGVDGHTWLDPQNAKVQAEEIRDALIALLPARADKLNANYAALAADLDALDAAMRAVSDKLKGRNLLASHPAYNYLVKRYEWNVTNLDLDPDAALADDAVADLRNQLADANPHPRVILWESRPLAATVDRLKDELNLRSVVFSPCENAPEGENDYLGVMRENIGRLSDTLTSKTTSPEPERQ